MERGRIEKLYVGPMFGRKSSKLIQRVENMREYAGKRIIVFKPAQDTRSKGGFIEDHDGSRMEAYEIDGNKPQDIPHVVALEEAKLGRRFDIIAFDEVQFFSIEAPQVFVSVVNKLLALGYNVIAAGLNFDFKGMPFGPTLALVGLCENSSQVEICYSYCKKCGDEALFSQRLTQTTNEIEAGNHYEPRCGSCFKPPEEKPLPS